MKIAVITPVFAVAGVPLAQIRLARALSSRGNFVELIIGCVPSDLAFERPSEIKITVLNSPRVRHMFWPLFWYFLSKKPDIVFVAEDHLTLVVLLAAILSFSSCKISGSSRILPSDRLAYSNKFFTKGWWLKQFMKCLMWRADVLSCVSKDMVSHYHSYFPGSKHVCIYNIIKDSLAIERSNEVSDHPWLFDGDVPVVISAGTFTKRKGFSDLMRAFSIVVSKRNCRLIILGDGYLRESLKSLAFELGISEYVDLPGVVNNPLKYFSKADVFVLSSYAEGLPNVLVEAMICGCTPVSTDCPTGPRELLQDGKFGYLVPMGNIEAMASAISHAIDHPIPPSFLDDAVKPFEEDAVISRHFKLLGLDNL